MELIVIRHGRTIWNEQKIHQGHTDGTLSEKGKEQVKHLAPVLAGMNIDVICASDLGRCKETVTLLSLDAPVQFDKRLRERYTSLCGTRKSEIDYDNLPPEAESWEKVQERVSSLLDSLRKEHNDDTILIVSHTGTIQKGLLPVLGVLLDERMKNASVTVLRVGEETEVLLLNDTSHLD